MRVIIARACRFLSLTCTLATLLQPYISVEYLTPTNLANCTPVIPLRSDSASIASRFSAGVRTRPTSSTFKISELDSIPVIATCYDAYSPI